MSQSIPERKTKTEYFLQQKPKEYKTWAYEDGPFEDLNHIRQKMEHDIAFWGKDFYLGPKAYDHRIVKRTTKIASEEVVEDGNKRCLALLTVRTPAKRTPMEKPKGRLA